MTEKNFLNVSTWIVHPVDYYSPKQCRNIPVTGYKIATKNGYIFDMVVEPFLPGFSNGLTCPLAQLTKSVTKFPATQVVPAQESHISCGWFQHRLYKCFLHTYRMLVFVLELDWQTPKEHITYCISDSLLRGQRYSKLSFLIPTCC